jgi:hypothetical protein
MIIFRCAASKFSNHQFNQNNFMKQIFLSASSRYFLIITLLAALLMPSCARKMTFNNSPIVPAATGSVKIKSDNNNNYSIDVSVTNLAPADKLTPPRKYYVVWMTSEDAGTKNIGQIESSGSLLSRTLKGSLKTVTSFKPQNIFITAEDNADVQYPGSTIVLNTN